MARPRASRSRSSPFPLGTSATYCTPGWAGSRATSSAESASAGIHLGDTKLVASMRDEAGVDERGDERQLAVGGNDARLVLEPVARAHLVDGDAGRHGALGRV